MMLKLRCLLTYAALLLIGASVWMSPQDAYAQACPAGRFCYYIPPDMKYGHGTGEDWDLIIASSFGTVNGSYRIGAGAPQSFSITPSTPLRVDLSPTQGVVNNYETVEQRGIYVEADQESLNVVHRRNVGNEQSSASIKDHTRALGRRFRLGGYALNATGGVDAPYDIMSVYAPTGATITVSAPPGAPTPFWQGTTSATVTISLSAGETYMLRTRGSNTASACTFDITGALVTSDRPISVVSGGRGWAGRSGLPATCGNNGGCGDDGVDHILPTSELGTEYVVSSYNTNASRTVAVVADEDATQVFINGTSVATINAGQSYYFQENGVTHIRTTKPAYVYQNAGLSGCELGLAFVPPVGFASTTTNTSAFNVIGSGSARVLIEATKVSSLRLDGMALVNPTVTAVPTRADLRIVSINSIAGGDHIITAGGDFQFGLVSAASGTGLFAYYNIFNKANCGDGVLDANEACDDNNLMSGDGCSSTCRIEVGTGGCVNDASCVAGAFCNAMNVCVACLSDNDCNDNNECTTDVCGGVSCTNTPKMLGASCGGGICNGSAMAPACQTCVDDKMGNAQDTGCPQGSPLCDTTGPAPVCRGCITNANCNDGNACTTDVCAAGSCVYAPVLAGTTCNANTGVCNGSPVSPSCDVCIDSSPIGQDAGCTMQAPYCDRSGASPVCVGCLTDSQCGSGQVCLQSKQCATVTVAISAPANMSTLNNSSPILRGTANAGQGVEVELLDSNGQVVLSTTVTALNGMWSVATSNLPQGSYTVRAVVRGNANMNATATSTFSIDTTPPAVAINTPSNGARTNDTTPTISGSAEASSALTVRIINSMGMVVQTIMPMVNMAGSWSFDANTLPQGNYTVEATATDNAGNMASTGPVAFIIDTTPPTVSITSPGAMGLTTNDTTPPINGAVELGSSVVVTIRDAMGNVVATRTPIPNAQGRWSFNAATLPQGSYTVTAVATDAAGNTATAGPNALVIDTSAPTVSIITPADGATVGEARPTLGGATEASASVLVTLLDAMGNAVFTQTVTANASGMWSATPAADLSTGAYTVRAVATDAAGNASAPVSSGFNVDLTGLAILLTAPADGGVTPLNTPLITGTTEPNTAVTIDLFDSAGMVIESLMATSDANGDFSVMAMMLVDGDYTARAQVTSPAGITSSDSNSFTVDTTPPGVTLDTPRDGTISQDDTPTITGSADAGATVTVTILDQAGVSVQTLTTIAGADGKWSVDAASLPDGDYTLSASAMDLAGNEAMTPPSTYTVDRSVPTLQIITPANQSVQTERAVVATGTSEPNQVVELELQDDQGNVLGTFSATTDANGDWSAPLGALTDGDYVLFASATGANNAVAKESTGFQVFSAQPNLSVTQPANGATTNDVRPPIMGTSDPGTTITVVLRDAQGQELETLTTTTDANGSWSVVPTNDLSEGSYQAQVTASDDVGEMTSVTVGFGVDLSAPSVTLSTPADGLQTAMNVLMATGEAEPGAVVSVSVKDAQGQEVFAGMTTAGADGKWSLPIAQLPDGTYTAQATATDGAGNMMSSAVNTFTIDTMAPRVTITSPAPGASITDTKPTITGTAEPGATVEVFVDGVRVGEATADAEGKWSLPLDDALSLGEHTVEARTTDGAGNQGSSGVVNITVVENTGSGITITGPTDGQQVTGTTVTVTGTGKPGSVITVTVGKQDKVITVGEDGTWTVTFEDVPAGETTITAKDPNGEGVTIIVTVIGEEQPESGGYIVVGGGCAQLPTDPRGQAPWLLLGLLGVGVLWRRRQQRAV